MRLRSDPDPSDRRVSNVVATPAGREELARARAALREVEGPPARRPGAAEARRLRQSLIAVARSVAEEVQAHDEATTGPPRRATPG